MLDKCLRGNEIATRWHVCLTSLGTCAEGVQFYCTYAAIPYCIIFPILELSVHDDYVCSFEIQCKIAMEFFFGP